MVIQTKNLSKVYNLGSPSKEVVAIKSLDLQVPQNSIFGFIGPNGAGKTTTIKLLLGLIKPTKGQATILGHDIFRETLEIRKRIGYLPQNPQFYAYMTARETLRFKARFYYSGPDAEIENRVLEMLALAGLEDKADRPIKGFSGGERQRLGIVQAQINHPELLILDEPAASLDPLGRRDVLDVMKELRQHTTIFYSTHILDDVQQVSDRVAILDHGEILAQGRLSEILNWDNVVEYSLTIEGDAREARVRLESKDWVSSILVLSEGDHEVWQVRVTDDAEAKSHLMRLILEDSDVYITEFTRKKYKLEDIFMKIIGKDSDGRQ